ncbi:MAG: ATP-binding protein [Candidatus Omnitrophica bacterium]|nr:ATP-binding protein [Candidatus Omnitrophota bacterium]
MVTDHLFDRQAYREVLEKRVIALKDGYRQNVALIGDEQVGKTCLIHGFLRGFLDSRFIMVYVEARPETLASFVRRFVGILLYNFLSNASVPLKEDLEFLVEKASGYIPRTTAKIQALLADVDRRKRESIFGELLSLTALIHQETGKFCVVFFDEFHLLEGLGSKSLYGEWSQRLLLDKTTLYVISSSAPYKAKAILARDLSLLFGNFEVIIVEPFDIPTSARFLEHLTQGFGLKEEERDFIIHFTGGSPFYLGVIAESLIARPGTGVADVLEQLLFCSSGVLHQRFTAHLKRFQDALVSADCLNIMNLVASGQNRVKDIAHILKKPVKEITGRVGFLLEKDVLVRCGDFLKVADRVFGFWLKSVHQEKRTSLTFDASNQKAGFRKGIETMLQEFAAVSHQSLGERMVGILRLFADDRIQIERKRITLNHFREIKPLDLKGRGLHEGLLCRSQDSLWIIGLGSDAVTEEDIAEFSKECKRYRGKLVRRIIITPRGIDTNSRLKALEEHIWTWGLDNINDMFDLFSKPRIIANV